ncbi:NADH-quinone oxidoreductase subunit C [Polluticoccus soli]|uniref:NADH-quinone oxidoreductase subunit C n=1 Tax=Polluticoccus soli TaxID=3034150 RepID=UPI0023E2F80F|nr:NADH-quinone oxidoreductase subunit C [Flavipsychrobacter sp. JY13-12]
MTNEIVKQRLSEKFGEQLAGFDESFGMLAVTAPAEMNMQILQFLHDDEQLKFRFLTDLTAVHYPDRKGEELCIVYHLHNLVDNIRLRLKVYIPIERPDVASATPLFSGANWMERESYDFYGVNFIGHPNLTRILNVDEMDYFPMRKEYAMEDPTRVDKDDEMFGRGGTVA